MNFTLVKKITVGSLSGGIIGYFILHPTFLLIDDYFSHHDFKLLESFLSSFNILHIQMAIFFIIFGVINGFLYEFFNFRINSLINKTQLLSITDELTQINNRRYFVKELEKEIERSKRTSQNLSLLILDINKFKYYNDAYGHIFGDKIIQTVARFLKETVRKTDFVARYEGDEFVMLMPEAEKSMAKILAERVQKKFSRNFFENHKLQIKIKINLSTGIASFPCDAKTADELMHYADLDLYKVKEEKKKEREFIITI